MRTASFIALLALSVFAGCDSTTVGSNDEQVVVSASLIAGQPLTHVELSLTRPIDAFFDPDEARVIDAEVSISLLDASGHVEEAVPYRYQGGQLGLYVPVSDTPPLALEGRTYQLDVVVPGSPARRLTATTTIPEAVDVVTPPDALVEYQSGQGPAFVVSQSEREGEKVVFLITVRSQDPVDFEQVVVEGDTLYRSVPESGFAPVPFVLSFAECEPEPNEQLLCGEDLSDFNGGSSPLINQESYIDLGNGSLQVNIPWLAFGFYGPADVNLVALDEALIDFLETQSLQFAPTTLSPGEIPNIVSNVDGGLGVFGSVAQVRVQTTVIPQSRPQ
ncbi:MAG: DUF4249 domain-containing protein [Rubricoccaceae bacterium]